MSIDLLAYLNYQTTVRHITIPHSSDNIPEVDNTMRIHGEYMTMMSPNIFFITRSQADIFPDLCIEEKATNVYVRFWKKI